MRTSLLASTDTPGSTAPLESFTSPEMMLCARAAPGMNRRATARPRLRLRESFVDIALLASLQHESTSPTTTPLRLLRGEWRHYTDALAHVNTNVDGMRRMKISKRRILRGCVVAAAVPAVSLRPRRHEALLFWNFVFF